LKFIFAFLLCVLLAANSSAQTETNDSETVVEEIRLMRASGANGELGEPTTIFTTTDVPIYCAVALRASDKAAVVKMNFVAVGASGLKANTLVVSVSYKTNGRETGVNFNASPGAKLWAAGKYRVDILLDGKTAKNLEFEIQTSVKETGKAKSLPPTKSKSKSRKS